MAIEAGRVLNERYRLIRPVGQGSQASVWVAEHLALTTHVAVKLISQELAKKDTARERFRREATAAAQLRSAHVVQILDHGIDGDQPFIVMELLDGEDLFERLAHRNRLSLRETSKIVTQVARALSRAHAAGIVHRDLKPENVFLCPNDDDEVVKVLDFGVAKVKDAAKVTMQKTGVGTLIGTPHYMSPEQVKGIGETDLHADLWALGVIAFQCVTGELPFDSEGVGDLLIKITIGDAPIPSKVYPGVSPNFDQWFAKACARDSRERFQSAREMAVALAGVVGVIDGIPPRAPTVRPPPELASVTGQHARAATQHLDTDDWEEIDAFDVVPQKPVVLGAPGKVVPATGAPAVPGPPAVQRVNTNPPPAAPRISAAPAAPPAEGHDIVDFDETIPAHDLASWRAIASEAPPPRPSSPQRESAPPQVPPPPPSSPRVVVNGAIASFDDAGARPPWEAPPSRPNLIAPVVLPPARGSGAGIPPPPASVPRPPSSSPSYSTHATAVPVVTPLESGRVLIPEAPPEFDGSKRRRLVRLLVAGLVVLAVGVTWTVVRSQIDFSYFSSPAPAAQPTTTTTTPTTTTTAAAPTATTTPSSTASAAATAVDPGKVSHPTKPAPSVNTWKPPRPRAPKPTGDGTIVIPEPDEEAVPPAP
jgi:serine/threonine-protein kinase